MSKLWVRVGSHVNKVFSVDHQMPIAEGRSRCVMFSGRVSRVGHICGPLVGGG